MFNVSQSCCYVVTVMRWMLDGELLLCCACNSGKMDANQWLQRDTKHK